MYMYIYTYALSLFTQVRSRFHSTCSVIWPWRGLCWLSPGDRSYGIDLIDCGIGLTPGSGYYPIAFGLPATVSDLC